MKNCLSVVGRILLGSATLTLAALAVLVLIGLRERHAQEATAARLFVARCRRCFAEYEGQAIFSVADDHYLCI